jgi:membrane fusion protein, multidrug efflux system
MKRFLQILIPLLLLAAAFVFFGVLPRLQNREELTREATETTNRLPIVNVLTVNVVSDTNGLTLPGQISPYRETGLFARTQGFVRQRYADLGARVRRGQLLVTIEAPEVEQDIARARADLSLAQSSLSRVNSVTLPGAVARQDIDNRQAAVSVSVANLRRIEALRGLQAVHAPFSGIITARNAEVGNLVQAGAGPPLFMLAQLDTVRVFVEVPQPYYRAIRVGLPAVVTVPELKGRFFNGRVVRTAGTLKPSTRTLLTEIAIPNRNGELVAGLYGQVRFGTVQAAIKPVMIPANTLLVTPDGPRVVQITANNMVNIRPITLGRDFGTTLEVTEGLRGGERLVQNPTDKLQPGGKVMVR